MSGRKSAFPMVPMHDAIATILREASALAAAVQNERVPLAQSVGRTIAHDIKAPGNLPPFRASVMDGYAVVSADGPGDYPMVAKALAGSGASVDAKLLPGQLAYITTGAPVPDGADAVVKIEDTEELPEDACGGVRVHICVRGEVKPGTAVRAVGSDIAEGEVVLRAGQLVGASEVGLLASVGSATAPVLRRPRVAVMSTGDELVDPSAPELGPAQIRDSNRAMLLAMAAECGCEVLDLGIVTDQERLLEETMARAVASADVVITSGGVSMGNRDLVKPLLAKLGTIHFGRLCMKPGKPTTFATLEGAEDKKVLFFALPGNPVSAFVTFHLCVVPALRRLRGMAPESCTYPTLPAVIKAPMRLDSVRPEYHRVLASVDPLTTTPSILAVSTGKQTSCRLLSARAANGLIYVPKGTGILEAGSVQELTLFGELLPPAE